MDEKEFYCSTLARQYGVPLMATATRGDVWFLIEYPGRWGTKAFEESDIPKNVKDCLTDLNFPGAEIRILLIKQTESRRRDGISFFVGQTPALNPRLFEYRLEKYTDILDLDLSPLVKGEIGDNAHIRHEPIYLVCANGIRDKCCAVYGPEVYKSMREEAGDSVWQSSHIGGHNQAPILLFFPHGVHYGRATPSEARGLVQSFQRGEVMLDSYRGRVCYETHLQAAEHFWRQKTGDLTLPGPQIRHVDQPGEHEWLVTLSRPDGSHQERIQLKRRFSDYAIPVTCTTTKESKIASFHWMG